VELFRQIVLTGNWVLDVGANIGAHTLFFARQVGDGGRVLAFEPQRVVFQTLCANMALNSITNVWCYPHACGSQAGTIILPEIDYRHENNFGGLSLRDPWEGEPVPLVPLDGLRLPRCNLIKIDVEGMEQAVLAGAVDTIARCKPVLYVENDRTDRSADLVRFIDQLGYAMYWHCTPLYNPNNYLGNPTNVFRKIFSFNMLCVHRSAEVCFEGFKPVEIPPKGPAEQPSLTG